MKRLLIIGILGLGCAQAYAQGNQPTPLDLLAGECQKVVDLNKDVDNMEKELMQLRSQLEQLRATWYENCRKVLSDPACKAEDIDELIKLTNPIFEAELLAQLKEAKANPGSVTLSPLTATPPRPADAKPPRKGKGAGHSPVAPAPSGEDNAAPGALQDNAAPGTPQDKAAPGAPQDKAAPGTPQDKADPVAGDDGKGTEPAVTTPVQSDPLTPPTPPAKGGKGDKKDEGKVTPANPPVEKGSKEEEKSREQNLMKEMNSKKKNNSNL